SGAIAASGDGSTIVMVRPDEPDVVRTGRAEAYLAGQDLTAVPIGNTAHQTAAQLLLDRAGTALAVAWLDETGDTIAVGVYRRGPFGWTLIGEAPLPGGATRAELVGYDP
ncbi:MAG TPA: hypothetical protein VK656_07480, partial [Candidatus Acidoferrum sp.]|nr:hypothetical protein [Candidatus Acidoferrum sp.]